MLVSSQKTESQAESFIILLLMKDLGSPPYRNIVVLSIGPITVTLL